MTSILEKARAEGYRDGASQQSMICHDDAYYQGQQNAWDDAPSRLRWWLFGLGCGATLANTLHCLW